MSHPKAYKSFLLECKNRKKFPIELADNYQRTPVDLFRLWLDQGGDWGKIKVTVRRGTRKESESRQASGGTKERDMKYSDDKKQKVVETCEKKRLVDVGSYVPQ